MSLNGIFDDVRDFLTPRQRPGNNDDEGLTVIAVTTMTAPQTFDGDAILVTETPNMVAGGAIAGGAVFASRTSTPEESIAAPTDALVDSSSPTIAVPTSNTFVTPVSTPINDPAAFGVTSSLSGARATTSSSAEPASEGLSGGAKAGIAFGVLIPLAALLIGALLIIRRKKQQQKNAGERLDDEKTAMANMPPPSSFPSTAPAQAPMQMQMSSGTPLAHAPVLSQPQVSSSFNGLGNAAPSSGNGAAMAAGAIGATAVGAAAIAKAPHSPTGSAWERPGNEKNANDPANPFGNHAETSAAQARAPSPGIDASDFPLPGSIAPSEKAISIAAMSTDNLSLAPGAPMASTVSLAPVSPLAVGAAAGAAGVAAGAAAAGASNRNSPPPAPVDNVYRVQLDFKPSMEDELDIRAGQLVRMLHSYDDGWALCMRMDRSQQGVVPRTCLSKNSVKPRPGPPPQQRGPPRNGPNGPNSPMRGPPPQGRPMTPTGGRNSPAPFQQAPRPMSPAGGRNSPAPGGRARAGSSAGAPGAAYAAYAPQGRSMSPGPYGAPGGMMPPPSRPDAASRPRANSLGSAGAQAPQLPPVKPLSPQSSSAGGVARKPVPGMAV